MAMFNYESEELYQMTRGEIQSSSSVYMADCKKEILTEVTPNYPKLTEYEKEWMYFAKNIYVGGTPVPLEYLEVQTYGEATVENAIPFHYKRAILKGQTETICDRFEQGSYSFSDANGIVSLTTPAMDRLRIKQPITGVNVTVRIILKNNYEMLTGVQDKDGKVVSTGWVTETTKNLVETDKFYFAMRKKDGSNISPNDLYEAITSVTGYDLFEMEHVKMPVLKTTGKNLFDGKLEKGLIDGKTGKPSNNEAFVRSVNFIKVQPNKKYVISEKDDSTNFRVYEYDENFNYIDNHSKKTFTTYSNAYYIKFRTFPKNSGDDVSRLDFKVMLETGDTATPYEPHKSNILTVNEEVTLRSNGDVYDELNLLTGRLTQRIDENNEVLAQSVVKTVDLNSRIKPYEGTNHYTVSSNTLPPQLLLSVPIESTGSQSLNDILTTE